MALFLGLPRLAGTRKTKPVWILLKQVTVSGSGIRWAICKSAPCSRQTTMPAPQLSVFYRPDALPATQQTASKHWAYKQNHVRQQHKCFSTQHGLKDTSWHIREQQSAERFEKSLDMQCIVPNCYQQARQSEYSDVLFHYHQ